jgi:DNA-binding IclR family transcriptional regulator
LKHSRSGLSVGQTALHAGLAKATTYRILSILEEHEMARRAPSGYMLGERAGRWGMSGSPGYGLRRGAIPHMIDVHRTTGLPVSLSVLSGLSVTALEVLFAETQRPQVERTELHSPAHCTAAGKTLLAHDPQSADAVLRSDVLTQFTARTITSRDRLLAELRVVRRTGVAKVHGERVHNLNEIAVPVYDRSRRVVAALAVAGFGDRLFQADIEPMLRRAGSSISAALTRQRHFSAGSPTR